MKTRTPSPSSMLVSSAAGLLLAFGASLVSAQPAPAASQATAAAAATAPAAPAAPVDTARAVQEAQAAAVPWLAIADAGKYADTWVQTSDSFKRVVPKEGWEPALRSVRSPLGAFKSRVLKSAEYKASIPGAPAGEYVVAQYESAFESRTGVLETITMVKGNDSGWRVSGYFVK